jgi:hypothetical protein
MIIDKFNLEMVFCKKNNSVIKAVPMSYKISSALQDKEIVTCYDVILKLEDGDSIIRSFFEIDGMLKSNAKDIFVNVLDLKADFLKPLGFDTLLMIRQREAKYNQFVKKYGKEFPELYL